MRFLPLALALLALGTAALGVTLGMRGMRAARDSSPPPPAQSAIMRDADPDFPGSAAIDAH